MKLGTNEPKKVMALGGLIVVAGIVWFINRSEDPAADRPPSTPAAAAPAQRRPQSSAAARRAETANAVVEPPRANVSRAGRSSAGGTSSQEFRPTLKPRDPNERIDPASIDPMLKLDLLARLQKVSVPSGQRSLFDFSSTPLPPLVAGNTKTPEPKIPIGKLGQAIKDTVAQNTAKPGEPPKPPPPPIPLKFYGFTSPQHSSVKRAFFLDGDDIVVANEGDLIKKRYKVIRIGLNSALLEDTEVKHQQTLPLVAELTG